MEQPNEQQAPRKREHEEQAAACPVAKRARVDTTDSTRQELPDLKDGLRNVLCDIADTKAEVSVVVVFGKFLASGQPQMPSVWLPRGFDGGIPKDYHDHVIRTLSGKDDYKHTDIAAKKMPAPYTLACSTNTRESHLPPSAIKCIPVKHALLWDGCVICTGPACAYLSVSVSFSSCV